MTAVPKTATTAHTTFPEQAMPRWQRAVLKVGSSLLTDGKGGLGKRNAAALANLIARFRDQGREVLLVSSGAVAAGRGVIASNGVGLAQRQALAAVGQTPMLALWQGLVEQPVAQVLLSHDDLRNRRRYLNARATLRELLRIGALPIVNENDTVAIDELKLGDNDNLAAVVATLVEADVLLIATDTAGLYTGHPVHDPDARPVPRIEEITPEVMLMAQGGAGSLGTGGMYTKLEAATKTAAAGIDTALFCGHDADTIAALGEDRLRGTFIPAHGDRLVARKLWLRHTPPSGGAIRVDEGAAEALSGQGASLLPGGIVSVEGDFCRDAMVDVLPARGHRRLARGLVQYDSAHLERIAGCHSRDIESVLGFHNGESVIRRDDLVLLTPAAAAATPELFTETL
ncbi:MAG: glutamate 5-kinase [Lysobacter sp.]|jgi:glutamate 5-kinase|uniref:Glutamate 5-kinase n=1 Tax=Lysobacter zhanggongensis TaxID=1774951 RepID=A0ABU7YRH5_9GAMM|nr:glutamate 5-kinase [Lysobacter sp.]MDV5980251.1 glutamate 5-kinase [Lysobacter sp.]